jgi:hypothetical protein
MKPIEKLLRCSVHVALAGLFAAGTGIALAQDKAPAKPAPAPDKAAAKPAPAAEKPPA